MRWQWGVVLGILLAGCDACGSRPAPPKPAATAAKKSPAVVFGRVRLADGVALPSYRDVDMERTVLRAGTGQLAEGLGRCEPISHEDRTPVRLSSDGYLTGVLVSASEFSDAKPRPPRDQPVSIGQDCRLHPRLIVAMEGDTLRVRNEVDFPFMPMFGSEPIARSLIPGQEFSYKLEHGGTVDAVLCTVTSPCGRSDVVVLHHPLYDVTDSDGRFRIENFPEDEEVTLNAWHPLFSRAHIEVTLGVGQEKEVEFVLTPAASIPPPAPGIAEGSD